MINKIRGRQILPIKFPSNSLKIDLKTSRLMPDLLNTFYNINKSHLWESKIKTVFAVNIKSLILLVFIFNRIFYTTYEKYINKKSILFHSWWNRRGKKYDILITNRLLCNHVNIYITSAIIDKNEKSRKKNYTFYSNLWSRYGNSFQ